MEISDVQSNPIHPPTLAPLPSPLLLLSLPPPPLRHSIVSREGVTNRELHEIIRKHVSRFVPSLNQNKRVPPLSHSTPLDAKAPVPSRVVPEGDSDAMLVDEPDSQEQTQEPGISSTRCLILSRNLCVIHGRYAVA